MEIDDLAAAFDALDPRPSLAQLFTLEQRVRPSLPEVAKLIVVHRDAIAADGARALLQRLAQPVGETWLEPLTPRTLAGQALWGHEGPIQWMRVDGGLLVTRGQEDGRLRRFDADGLCREDRPATREDDARSLGEVRVSLVGLRVELHELGTGRALDSFELDSGDGYRWLERAELLDSGHIALMMGEDYPGSLYGPQYEWLRLDPRDRSRCKLEAPRKQLRFAGRIAVAQPEGSVRLVAGLDALEHERLHQWRVRAVALGAGRLVSASDGGICIHDRDGRVLERGRASQRCIEHIVIGDRIVTTSRYSREFVQERPHARVWDADSGAPGLRVDAGERYADFISCDPTGSRVAYTVDGVLHLRELEAEAEPRVVPLTWHWNRVHAWSADGERLAIQHSGRAPTVWNLATGERERILTTDVLDSAHFGISEDGAVVTVDHSFYRLRAFQVGDGVALPCLEPGLNLRCSASRGGKGVAGGVGGGYWFDLATNARVRHKQGPWIYACGVGGARAALAGSDGVHVVELESGELLWHWPGEGPAQCQVVVLADAIVCLDERGQLTTLVEGAIELQRSVCPVELTQAPSMCGLPDASVLVGTPDGWLRRWDPYTGDLIEEWALGGTRIDELSHGGGKVLLRRWTHSSEQEWLAFELEGWVPVALPAGAQRPRLTPDGTRLISLDIVARLDLLDARSGALLEQRPFGSWRAVEALAVEGGAVRVREPVEVSDGLHSVVAGEDGTLEVRRGGELVARWVGTRAWSCVAIDGDRIAAGDTRGDVAVWALKRSL